jgi:hypothetical protein
MVMIWICITDYISGQSNGNPVPCTPIRSQPESHGWSKVTVMSSATLSSVGVTVFNPSINYARPRLKISAPKFTHSWGLGPPARWEFVASKLLSQSATGWNYLGKQRSHTVMEPTGLLSSSNALISYTSDDLSDVVEYERNDSSRGKKVWKKWKG